MILILLELVGKFFSLTVNSYQKQLVSLLMEKIRYTFLGWGEPAMQSYTLTHFSHTLGFAGRYTVSSFFAFSRDSLLCFLFLQSYVLASDKLNGVIKTDSFSNSVNSKQIKPVFILILILESSPLLQDLKWEGHECAGLDILFHVSNASWIHS